MSNEGNPNQPLNPAVAIGSRREFVHRAWIIVSMLAGVVAFYVLFWFASQIFLILFAGVLFAILLHTIADWIRRFTRLPHTLALSLALACIVGMFVGVGWIVAGPAGEQFTQLSMRLPEAWSQLQKRLEEYTWAKFFLDRAQSLTAEFGPMLARMTDIFTLTLEGLTSVLAIFFFSIYFASDPDLYLNGFLSLFPREKRPRLLAIMNEIGSTLKRWLLGQLLAMTLVGLLTWVGLSLLDVPLSGVLGLIAGILDFIPIVGPFIAGVLATLLGFLDGPTTALYVACVFVAIQFTEGHVLIPMVQKYATQLPPVLTILGLALFAKLFGLLGLFLAMPLMIVAVILIKKMYQEEVLHEKT